MEENPITETTPVPEYAAWDEWNPQEYNNEYYAEVTLDGLYLMEWVVESVAKSEPVDIALEFGAGPTILHQIPLVSKAREIHVSEYLTVNREEIQRWIDRAPGSHDWNVFTREFLKMEGHEDASAESVTAREEELRRKITAVLPCDANLDDPMGPEKRERYPLVTALCCADSATNSKDTWRLFMTNIASLVKPGGMLILSACGEHSFYKVGERVFPGACVSGRDMLSCLMDLGFRDIDVRMREVPDSSGQGFGCTILARAIKPAR